MSYYTRRGFSRSLGLGALLFTSSPALLARSLPNDERPAQSFYAIAFSSWCFHMALWKGEMKATDLPKIANDLDVTALEWTAKTFRDLRAGRELMYKAPPPAFFRTLRQAADDASVSSEVLNVGGPFFLASKDKAVRQKAIDYIMQYIEPAQILGAGILRTELYYDGKRVAGWKQSALGYATEALLQLLDLTKDSGLKINIENHHGISSQPEWLSQLMSAIDDPRFGLTLDTNNFRTDVDNPYAADANALPVYADRYAGMERLIKHANWISAKFYAFDSTGYEISMNYPRIFDIILGSGYQGFVSVEYEGHGDPMEGLRKSVAMLEKFRRAEK